MGRQPMDDDRIDRFGALGGAVVREIVRRLVEAHGDPTQIAESIKHVLRDVARTNKTLCAAARREMWYVLSLAPTRAVFDGAPARFYERGARGQRCARGDPRRADEQRAHAAHRGTRARRAERGRRGAQREAHAKHERGDRGR